MLQMNKEHSSNNIELMATRTTAGTSGVDWVIIYTTQNAVDMNPIDYPTIQHKKGLPPSN